MDLSAIIFNNGILICDDNFHFKSVCYDKQEIKDIVDRTSALFSPYSYYSYSKLLFLPGKTDVNKLSHKVIKNENVGYAKKNIDNPLLKDKLTLDEYNQLDNGLKGDYVEKKDFVQVSHYIPLKWSYVLSVDTDYHEVEYKYPELIRVQNDEDSKIEVEREFVPVNVKISKLTDFFNDFSKKVFTKGNTEYSLQYYYQQRAKFEAILRKRTIGDYVKHEIKKSNGCSYATPRYVTREACPQTIKSIIVNLNELEKMLQGKNAYELEQKLRNIMKALTFEEEIKNEI